MWYFTPYCLWKIFSTSFSICWRKCGNIGNFLHILWACSKLSAFWACVSLISTVTNSKIQLDLALALLLLNTECWPHTHICFTPHCLIATRKTAAAAWKQNNLPDPNPFLHSLHSQAQFIFMFALKNGKWESFWCGLRVWSQQVLHCPMVALCDKLPNTMYSPYQHHSIL